MVPEQLDPLFKVTSVTSPAGSSTVITSIGGTEVPGGTVVTYGSIPAESGNLTPKGVTAIEALRNWAAAGRRDSDKL